MFFNPATSSLTKVSTEQIPTQSLTEIQQSHLTKPSKMCLQEHIPSVTYVPDLSNTLRYLENFEASDTYEQVNQPHTNDEVIEEENQRIQTLDPEDEDGIIGSIIDANVAPIDFSLEADYEDIFLHPNLSRRSDRPAQMLFLDDLDEDEGHLIEMMTEWTEICLNLPAQDEDKYTPHAIDARIGSLVEKFLPMRLEFSQNNWIGELMLGTVAAKLTGEVGNGDELKTWQPQMGVSGIRHVQLPDGRSTDALQFIGPAEPGRLVWIPKDGFKQQERLERYEEIESELREAEIGLVALARRIAREVAVAVISYAIEATQSHRRAVLDRLQIERAVREILGEEWFHLPFDLDGSLQSWSIDWVLKPDEELAFPEAGLLVGLDDAYDEESEEELEDEEDRDFDVPEEADEGEHDDEEDDGEHDGGPDEAKEADEGEDEEKELVENTVSKLTLSEPRSHE